jgi:poly-gamma-glutamate synthesis protein (capsule biosynthesis protein)
MMWRASNKRIFLFIAPIGLGALIGYSAFFIVQFAGNAEFSVAPFVAADVTGAAPTHDSSATAPDEGFYYKPLLDPQAQILKEGKVVYADLDTMLLTLWRDGKAEREMPIKSKGKPGSFWETPTGEYRVLTREETHFSSIGDVWMPYSIGFFGNFFIHGWPYYPSGKQVAEGFSGGCIRLATTDAKVVFDFVDAGTPIIVAGDHNPQASERGYIALRHTAPPHLSAKAFLAGDLDSHYTFLEKNRSDVRSIASITKLMTAAVSLEAINQDTQAEIDKVDLDIHGETGSLALGEKFSAKQLLAPLLLASSNDAAYALARMIGTGRFVELMNQKAAALGLANTRYTDPSGLEMTNVSTAEELLSLLKYLRDVRSPILEMTARRSSRLTTNKSTHTWFNFNWKSNDPEFIGGKIGYIEAAGKTMVALFRVPVSEFTTRDIGIVVLGSQDQERDEKEILAWIKENFVYGSVAGGTTPSGSPFVITNGAYGPDEKYDMLFVGDIMMDRGIEQIIAGEGKGDMLYPFQNVRDMLAKPTITFANLEGPISNVGSNHGSVFSFRMDPATTKALYDVGVDIVSVANNHMGDYGREALEDTFRRLRRAGIAYTGAGWNHAEAVTPTILERNGQRIGFLGFSDVGPNWIEARDALSGVAIAGTQEVTDAVRQAQSLVDILIVSFHFGDEYETKSNNIQKELAHAAIDAGAKVVIGTHPHVAQEVEEYHGGVIAYSLGNFIFDQAFSKDTKNALALKLYMKGKTIERTESIPITFNEHYQPSQAQ